MRRPDAIFCVQRNDYRDWDRETGARTVELRIAELRKNSCFPDFIERAACPFGPLTTG
jgi:transposase-like protein